MAQGTSLTRPTTSELMKLAMRPKNSPKGVAAAEQSTVEGHATVPNRGNFERVGPEIARLVEQNEAEPAAEHDAERDPKQKIVGLAYGQRRFAVPQIWPRQKIAPIEPAEQDAGHIGEAIPADGERPDLERNRIDDGVGDSEKRHVAPRSPRTAVDPSPPAPRLSRRRGARGLALDWEGAEPHSLVTRPSSRVHA